MHERGFWLDPELRFAGDWRTGHPKLVAWLDRFAARVPAFAATKVAA